MQWSGSLCGQRQLFADMLFQAIPKIMLHDRCATFSNLSLSVEVRDWI